MDFPTFDQVLSILDLAPVVDETSLSPEDEYGTAESSLQPEETTEGEVGREELVFPDSMGISGPGLPFPDVNRKNR